MFRNYLAAALHNLARNKLYAAINIFGLAAGFAAAIIIGLYVRDQFSYDKWIPHYDRIARVGEISSTPDRPHLVIDVSRPTIGPLFKTVFPSLAAVARLRGGMARLKHGDTEGDDIVAWVDPGFFDIFALPTIAGDLKTALARPDGIVLTHTAARKYFGRDDLVGESIDVSGHPMRVTAVLEDLPANTHLPNQIIASGEAPFSMLYGLARNHPGEDDVYTYFRLKQGASLDALQKAMPDFVDRYINVGTNARPNSYFLELVPIADIHLKPAGLIPMKPSGDRDTLYAIIAIAVLIVLVAAINFANLMAARASQRAIEVGVRKTTGARRRDLILQFLGESFLSICLAMALAMALVELLLPSFSTYMDASLNFTYWRDPELIAAIALLIAVVGIAAGLYPACVLSGFRPASALKGNAMSATNPRIIRALLVVLQFSTLIAALVMTGTVFRQMQFALSEALRVDQDQVLLINGGCTNAFKDAVASLPGVRSAACSGRTALSMGFMDTGIQLADGTVVQSRQSQVDFGFFELYGLKPLAGRFFERNHADDIATDGSAANPSIVLNQSAVRKLGFASPKSAIGQSVAWFRNNGNDLAPPQRSTVIGVVQDFSMNSVRERIEPQIFYIDPKFFNLTNVKLDGAKIPETLAGIDRLWRMLSADMPSNNTFLDEMMRRKYLDIIRQGDAFTLFTSIALLIACVGLFGLAVTAAERRTKEIGVRKAMGARQTDILKLVTWEFVRPVLLANLIAWPVAYYFMERWLAGFAYHIALDPWLFCASGLFALLIAAATVTAQSLLAARANPVTALRYE